MVLVAIINLITTLLILILERTKMIGILRSLGMAIGSLRAVFLLFALRILVKGLVIGNILGIGICLLQKNFSFIKLSEEDYYLSTAPIHLIWTWIMILNVGTIIVVLICLLIPSMLVGRLDPVKAIRFS
jgi:lipoprotein-releasing system permease protein